MQENAHLNVIRLEHKDKTEELEKANTKINYWRKYKVHVAKHLFQLRGGVLLES